MTIRCWFWFCALLLLPLPGARVAGATVLAVCATRCPFRDLQSAIDAAASGDTVTIPPGLHPGPFRVSGKSLVLRGMGVATDAPAGRVPLSRRGTLPTLVGSGLGPVLDTECAGVGQQIEVVGLAITGGDASDFATRIFDGGGIRNIGCRLVVRASMIASNRAFAAGGGIFSTGPTLVERSTVTDNTGNFGGGAHVEAPTVVTASVFSGNVGFASVGVQPGGGGLYATSDLSVTDSVFRDNSSPFTRSAGGIWFVAPGRIEVRHTRFARNLGSAVRNERGSMEVSDSTFEENGLPNLGSTTATGPEPPPAYGPTSAAGIVSGGQATITGCMFLGNAGFDAGTILNTGTMWLGDSTVARGVARCGPSDCGWGGAIANLGDMEVLRATIEDNSASAGGGGIFNWFGSMVLTDSRIVGNRVADGDTVVAASGVGGGVYSAGGPLSLKGCTVTGNLPENCAGNVACP